VLIIDTETTSLTPDYASGTGVIWEAAIIELAHGDEYAWRMEPDVSVANPEALAIGRYHERTEGMRHATPAEVDQRYGLRAAPGSWRTNVWNLAQVRPGSPEHWSDPADLAQVLTEHFLRDAVLVAANPAFDAGFLSAFLAHHGQAPTWHYRLRDIGSMAYGYLCRVATEPPAIDASTDVMAEALGVDPGQFGRHSALGDCRLVNAMMRVIEGGQL
jgi:hypothetical protein